jgi:SAM-dependent methyltransferase
VADTPGKSQAGYDPEFFAQLVRAEDRHFWFRHRNRVIAAIVGSIVPDLPAPFHVLEVGCGTGNTLRVLEQVCRGGSLTGSDPFEEALAIARGRVQCALIRGDVEQLSFPHPFDLIAAFDVLEHIDDDVAAARRLRTALTPGGRLVVTVPAHQHLWSYADDAAHHCRRYSRDELARLLERCGYTVEYLSHFMCWLYPLMWARRRGSGVRRGSDRDAFTRTLQDLKVVPGINPVLLWMLASELPLIRRRRVLPLGTSLLAVARAT